MAEKKADDAVREIKPSEWANRPVIATFGVDYWLVGMNGLAALNYEELGKEACALAEPVYDQLLMKDLGLEEGEDGEVTLTISLDDATSQAEDEQQEAISSHHFFTCPAELAKRALFLHLGMRVRGRYITGKPVTGEIVGGNWSYVTVRDDTMQEYPSVPVNSLKILSGDGDQGQEEPGNKSEETGRESGPFTEMESELVKTTQTSKSKVTLHWKSHFDGSRVKGVYWWNGPQYTVWIHKCRQGWEAYAGDRGHGDILAFKSLGEVRSHIAEKGDQF